MRISDFSSENKISIDTIRYYIKEHLLHPVKKGNYFHFDDNAQRELDLIKKLKSYRFSIKEIKQIFHTEKLSNIKYLDTNSFLNNIYANKKKEIDDEVATLLSIKEQLSKEISNFSLNNNESKNSIGLSLDFIQYLGCPTCNNGITLDTATIKNNYIYKGTATCDCGFRLDIDDGILIPFTDDIYVLDPINGTTINDVIESSPTSFMDFMFNSIESILKLTSTEELDNKVILDIKCGVGVLPLEILKANISFKFLILVDEDINKLKIAKASIEKKYNNANIIFVCCDINNLPLKPSTIDLCVDFNGSFINGFRLQENTYNMLLPYMSKCSIIIGLYIYFSKFNMLNRLPPQLRSNFDGKTMFQFLQNNGYVSQLANTEKSITEGNNVADFFKPGDEVLASIRLYKR